MTAAAQVIAVNGTEFAVESGVVVSIGRDLASDIAIDDLSVSRHHATLTSEARGWVFRDLGSANGSFLEGRRVAELVVRRSLILRLGGADDGAPIEITLPGVTAPVGGVDDALGAATVIAAPRAPAGEAAAVATIPAPAAEAPVPLATDPSPPPPPPPAPAAPTRRRPMVRLLVPGVALVAIGGLLPWYGSGDFSVSAWDVSLKFLFVDVNETGSPWLGPCLLIPLALLLPLLVRRSPPWWLVAVAAGFAVAAALNAIARSDQIELAGPEVRIGVWVTLAGGVVLVLDTLRLLWKTK